MRVPPALVSRPRRHARYMRGPPALITCEGNHASGRPRSQRKPRWLLRTVAAAHWLARAAAFSTTGYSVFSLAARACLPPGQGGRLASTHRRRPPHMHTLCTCALPPHAHRRTCTAAACAHALCRRTHARALCRRTCTCALPPHAQPRSCELRAEIASAARREQASGSPLRICSHLACRCELDVSSM